MSNRIHIIIAEPSTVIRRGIIDILQSEATLSCDIAEVGDISTLGTATLHQTPDLLIVNPTQIGMAGLAQLRTDLGSESLKVMALQSSFIDQSTLVSYDEAISIFDSAQTIIRKVVETTHAQSEIETKKELSQREREIIICVVKGMTNKQIAESLYLSTHTVIAHRRNIANKLQIHSPSGLTIYAIVNKLVDLADIKNI